MAGVSNQEAYNMATGQMGLKANNTCQYGAPKQKKPAYKHDFSDAIKRRVMRSDQDE